MKKFKQIVFLKLSGGTTLCFALCFLCGLLLLLASLKLFSAGVQVEIDRYDVEKLDMIKTS